MSLLVIIALITITITCEYLCLQMKEPLAVFINSDTGII